MIKNKFFYEQRHLFQEYNSVLQAKLRFWIYWYTYACGGGGDIMSKTCMMCPNHQPTSMCAGLLIVHSVIIVTAMIIAVAMITVVILAIPVVIIGVRFVVLIIQHLII